MISYYISIKLYRLLNNNCPWCDLSSHVWIYEFLFSHEYISMWSTTGRWWGWN